MNNPVGWLECFQATRGRAGQFIALVAAIFALTAQPFYLLPQEQSVPIFLSLMLVYIFIKPPRRAGDGGYGAASLFLDLLLVLLCLAVGLYLAFNYEAIIRERPSMPNRTDLIFGFIAVLLVLEATRRTAGKALVVVAVVAIIYTFAGPYFPDLIASKGYSLKRVIGKLFMPGDGIYGLPTKVLLQYVVLFMILGSILEASGAAEFLTDLARSLAGGVTGGIAKVAVVASAFEGTISGSAVANVVGSGSLTIPAMKKAGYEPHVAGAIEAVASTGGQIMPPVMGAAAFLMADYIQVPYGKVALAALLPAVMYFLADYLAIHFYAIQAGLKGEPKSSLPRTWEVLRSRGYYLIPIVGIVYLLGAGFSPTMAGLGAVVLAFLSSFFCRERALTPKRLVSTLIKAGESFGELAAISATAGLIMALINLTGLGPRLSSVLIDLSGGNTLLLLSLTAVTSLIMGMGVPTTVAYVVLATLVAPALTGMGINILAAHLFIFYFGMISMITPPVALAAYAGAAIAGCNANRVGWTAFRFALPSLFIAFFFAYNPGLLMISGIGGAVLPALRAVIATIALAASFSGYLLKQANPFQRTLLLVGALGTLHVNAWTDLLALGALVIVLAWQAIERREFSEKATV